METKLKNKWLEALRSGKYKKNKGRLRRKNNNGYGYCCLGVLCDIVDPKGFVRGKGYVCGKSHSTLMLPEKFREKVGISCDHMAELANINDYSDTFREVIEFIEKL